MDKLRDIIELLDSNELIVITYKSSVGAEPHYFDVIYTGYVDGIPWTFLNYNLFKTDKTECIHIGYTLEDGDEKCAFYIYVTD